MSRPGASESAANAAGDPGYAPETAMQKFRSAVTSCFWELEAHLADIFGLNDSKYQWAVDQYMDEKQEEEDRVAFEREEAERQIEEENAKLADDAAKLEGGEAEAATVGLNSAAARSEREG